jgi:transposase-like protein
MFKGRHFDQSVILLCVRWYLAYNLSLRDLEEMMAERGLSVDHSTVHRWVVHFAPQLLARFNGRKRTVTGKWHMDETYIKVGCRWMYLYRAIDSVGDTVEFLFSEHRDLRAAKRFFRMALQRHGRPELRRVRERPARRRNSEGWPQRRTTTNGQSQQRGRRRCRCSSRVIDAYSLATSRRHGLAVQER